MANGLILILMCASPNVRDLDGLRQPRRARGVHVEDAVRRQDLRRHPLRLRLAAAAFDLRVEEQGTSERRRGGGQGQPGAGEAVVELEPLLSGRLQEVVFHLLDGCKAEYTQYELYGTLGETS